MLTHHFLVPVMHLTAREVFSHQTENHLLCFHHVMNDYEREGENNETVELVGNRYPGVLSHCRRPNMGEGRRQRYANAGAIHAIQAIQNSDGGGANRQKFIGAGSANVEG